MCQKIKRDAFFCNIISGENDEMVKLYDLTDLCKDKIVSGENPFTVPVGLLCHRVARNLRTSGQRRNADSRAMFENCLRLLDDSKHCQVGVKICPIFLEGLPICNVL